MLMRIDALLSSFSLVVEAWEYGFYRVEGVVNNARAQDLAMMRTKNDPCVCAVIRAKMLVKNLFRLRKRQRSQQYRSLGQGVAEAGVAVPRKALFGYGEGDVRVGLIFLENVGLP